MRSVFSPAIWVLVQYAGIWGPLAFYSLAFFFPFLSFALFFLIQYRRLVVPLPLLRSRQLILGDVLDLALRISEETMDIHILGSVNTEPY